ncbi:hypothetical protein ME1_00954 [Bartonella vinsonii subsp. arupensis OK-94-513]|uniref:Uncharacterized protein n=2 Tax=Bartonella vinsonii subsp. arupensis TaxID=110578 RepID=J1JU30_BARVI|nr:hypothetical protein ME1_00954 [Bartonella vinsonii subsp. arupensis OK-94-513]EJF96786.1 hypothetical protein MEI_01398 [Bartonella vinsonii subsp. arupensis Pm136co]
MAKKLDISVAFLSSVEIGKKSVPVGMEEKIIELYALDQETAERLRRESDACRHIFMIKPSDQLRCETAGMFVRTLNSLTPLELEFVKEFLAQLEKEKAKKNAPVVEA